MRVRDLMTMELETIQPSASLKEAARRMVARGVSGLPVVDADGKLVGIITEADFLSRELGRNQGRRRLLDSLFEGGAEPHEAETVEEAMSGNPVVIYPDAGLTEAARVMVSHGVKRLPVIDDDGVLIGVLSRADIVNAFTVPDDVIEDEIREDILSRVLLLEPGAVDVTVSEGVVTLAGSLPTRSDARLLEELTRRLDGVVRIETKLEFDEDDTA